MQPRPSHLSTGAAPEQAERIQRLPQGFATNPTDLRVQDARRAPVPERRLTELASAHDCRLTRCPWPRSGSMPGRAAARLATGSDLPLRGALRGALRLQPQNGAALSSLCRLVARAGGGWVPSSSRRQEAPPLPGRVRSWPRSAALARLGDSRGAPPLTARRGRPRAIPLQGAAQLAEDADERVRAPSCTNGACPAARAARVERMARLLPSSEGRARSSSARGRARTPTGGDRSSG
jgi:hypothetical protein